ncbi:MAG: hypothetical protein ABW321_14945 [Polyangiales bacterium]
MKVGFRVLAVLMVAGCDVLPTNESAGYGGQTASVPAAFNASCPTLDGRYLLTYQRVSTAPSDQECRDTFTEEPRFVEGVSMPTVLAGMFTCTAGDRFPAPCELVRDTTCDAREELTESPLGTARIVGRLLVDDRGRLAGEAQITIRAGESCSSLYRVTGFKQ